MRHNKEILTSIIVDVLTGLPTKERHKAEAVAILGKNGDRKKYASFK